ncbi:hypothetical protein DFR65_102269 [Oceanihabitans sediminis]|uniref:Uncharacterized protein n=1 Tax=Oceanihabitans sediminis TaxID=1812012 RepID=A0A368P532_9FLAO|nr:DUF6617 family protein [Oceanihabitans sediminis]RBP32933.1 hypothetical protein DFR65_102269 [Oceanihabitans sediminis]RCU57546.1 hypothetical protein DU428_07045 [Oceanihabitans sediminis]
MKGSIFSSLVSITNGLHRDNRKEKDFKHLLSDFKLNPKANNAVFKVNFKKPLNAKKEYYHKLIFNETERTVVSFVKEFPENATVPENKYSFTILLNKFDKYLNDIANYINNRAITADFNIDDNYIINYLKVSVIRLYAELQEQYGQFSEDSKFTILEIAEKYFNDTTFNINQIVKTNIKEIVIKKEPRATAKPKTSFGYKNKDTSTLLTVLKQLNLKIDLLDNRSTVEQLQKLLLSKDFRVIDFQIYLQCETTQFSYVVKKLKPFFNSFNPTSIERSGKFITKTGTPLKANNLYKNKVHNPKEKEVIDRIIQQLQ